MRLRKNLYGKFAKSQTCEKASHTPDFDFQICEICENVMKYLVEWQYEPFSMDQRRSPADFSLNEILNMFNVLIC